MALKTVRVIAPSRSLRIISQEVRQLAVQRLASLNLKVEFSKNCEAENYFLDSAPVDKRLEDLVSAVMDEQVDLIMSSIGGLTSIELLNKFDFSLLKNKPKKICGFSDITILLNSIFAKTGLKTYLGPHFSTFGMLKGIEYIENYFIKCVIKEEPFIWEPSEYWSDDKWYLDQQGRTFHKNEGPWILNPGQSEGIIIGGNLICLCALLGTEFMPDLTGTILIAELDEESRPDLFFFRLLYSIFLQPNAEKIKGLLIGRFQKNFGISRSELEKMIKALPLQQNIPVIANLDFGHTTPFVTLPVGGRIEISTNPKLTIRVDP
ncbi:MAG: LD-carboxypeptidase [Deltaproteobacteria bacterium]|nr:LD-carboxypeptidase [Deltaproteobacteria bacterium]MCX7952243.1 LD-carboxypeptidase [Deltaproteobacteria bacterium]